MPNGMRDYSVTQEAAPPGALLISVEMTPWENAEWRPEADPSNPVDPEVQEQLETITINYQHPGRIRMDGVWYQRHPRA